jgi:hypothetical protein
VYFSFASEESDLYRVMFLEPAHDAVDAEIGWDTFGALVSGVQRSIDGGRFTTGDVQRRATALWALAHGTATLHLAGLLDEAAAIGALGSAAFHIFVGYGDPTTTAGRSLAAGFERARLPSASSAVGAEIGRRGGHR